MSTYSRKSISVSHRALAASLLASGALGIGIGELAAPLSQSQAHPVAVAAKAPAACASFATSVGHGFEVLGTILDDAAKYPPLISKAEQAGAAHSSSRIAALTAKVKSINAAILTQSNRFSALKAPLLAEEKKCLS
jgi:hypothetical protein